MGEKAAEEKKKDGADKGAKAADKKDEKKKSSSPKRIWRSRKSRIDGREERGPQSRCCKAGDGDDEKRDQVSHEVSLFPRPLA